ncbi:MAG: methyltransferase domain-containing protein [Candidatus Woesearchaeota archaeon]
MFKAWNHGRDIAKIKNLIKSNRTSLIKNKFKKLKQEELKELVSIAKAQIKAENLFSKGFKMFLNEEDLRFTTQEFIADYRARKIYSFVGKEKIVDLCCGIGSQTISFAKYFRHVLAIDIDERKINYAFKNIQHRDLRNVTLLRGDIFDKEIIKKVSDFKPKVIFCDPQRKEKGLREEERELIKNIIKNYSNITNNLVIEAPPFINIQKLKEELKKEFNLDFEAEFLSQDQKLKRLTLYFSELKRADYSIINFPEEKIIYLNSENNDSIIKETNDLKDYLLEPNTALKRASMIHKALEIAGIKAEAFDFGRNLILTSKEKISDENIKVFFQQYKVLFSKESNKECDEEIIKKLQEFNAKYVILKQGFKPENYWGVRNYYERELNSTTNKILYLFYLKNKLIITELEP